MNAKNWFASMLNHKTARPLARSRSRQRPALEALEGRIAPATITVLTSDDAPGSVTEN